MTRVTLIEAWPTPWDAEDRLVGNQSLPLAPSAVALIGAAVGRLVYPIDALYRCAANEATNQAAKIVARNFSLRPHDRDDLDELHLGTWQGLTRTEARFRFPSAYEPWLAHADMVRPPDGETLAEAMDRLGGAWRKIARRNRGKTMALALRPMALQIVLGLLRHEDAATIATHLHNHEGLATIELGDEDSGKTS